jgi:hypothetical protein
VPPGRRIEFITPFNSTEAGVMGPFWMESARVCKQVQPAASATSHNIRFMMPSQFPARFQ